MRNGKALPPSALLLEGRLDLRGLEDLILGDLGIRVEALPLEADPVDFAAQAHLNLVVVHIGVTEPYDETIIDRFHRDRRTRAIPVVAIAASEKRAASAKASPNVSAIVVAPYDIEAFENAVRTALKLGVPSAEIPATGRVVPEPARFAAAEIDRDARALALQTLDSLLETEPYRARFPGLTPGLVEDVGSIVAQVAEGLGRGLTPRELWESPAARKLFSAHLRAREEQGINRKAVVEEPLALSRQIDQFLAGLVGKHGLTASDIPTVGRLCRAFLQDYSRRVEAQYPGPR